MPDGLCFSIRMHLAATATSMHRGMVSMCVRVVWFVGFALYLHLQNAHSGQVQQQQAQLESEMAAMKARLQQEEEERQRLQQQVQALEKERTAAAEQRKRARYASLRWSVWRGWDGWWERAIPCMARAYPCPAYLPTHRRVDV